MAVYMIGAIHKFIGTSGDTKPTGVPVGSEFFETDTKATYVCTDGTNWVNKV